MRVVLIFIFTDPLHDREGHNFGFWIRDGLLISSGLMSKSCSRAVDSSPLAGIRRDADF